MNRKRHVATFLFVWFDRERGGLWKRYVEDVEWKSVSPQRANELVISDVQSNVTLHIKYPLDWSETDMCYLAETQIIPAWRKVNAYFHAGIDPD